jgi:hypothetical protein
VIDFERPPSGGFAAQIRDAPGARIADVVPLEGGRGAPSVPAGEWFLALECEGHADVHAPFPVRPGERVRVALALEPGIERTLRCVPTAVWNGMEVRVRDASGAPRLVRGFQRSGPVRLDDPTPGLLVTLPTGTFSVEASTDTGLVARASFDVRALEPQDAAHVFELR